MKRSLLATKFQFPPQRGGIATLVAGIAASLGPERVRCHVGIARQSPMDDPGVEVRRRVVRLEPGLRQEAVFTGGLLATLLRDRVQAVQFAVVDDAAYAQPLVQRLLRLPTLIYAHGNEVLAAQRGAWERLRRAFREADAVVALSGFTIGHLMQIGVARSRIHLLKPGCDTARFAPGAADPVLARRVLGPLAGGRVILTVGRLVPRKGQDLMLRALPAILRRHPDTVYLAVGEGPYAAALQDLAAECGVTRQVVWAGAIPEEQLPELYRLAELFVMPSRADLDENDVEGFGLVFLEAAAAGLPVVGGRSGGIADAVAEGRTGILIDPTSPDQLASAVSGVLDDRVRAQAMGRAGRDRVLREGFTWTEAANTVQEIIAGLAKS